MHFKFYASGYTVHTIQKLLLEGHTWQKIIDQTGACKSTVAYQARKLRNGIRTRPAKKYDWTAIGNYAKKHTVAETVTRFRFAPCSWSKAVRLGKVAARPKKRNLSEVMVQNSTYSRSCLKKQIIDLKLIPYLCKICGLKPEWNGKPLVLRLDHENGIRNDHRLKNLRFICPNCDSQLPTFGARNIKRTRIAQLVTRPALNGEIPGSCPGPGANL